MDIPLQFRTLCLLVGCVLITPVAAGAAQTDQQNVNPDANGIYRQGPGVVMPKVLHAVDPSFTDEARRLRISGDARVQIVVDADGSIHNPHIIKSIADPYTNPNDRAAALTLDQQAIEAVNQYKFSPGTFQDKLVPIFVTIEISFNLAPIDDPNRIFSRGPGVVMPQLTRTAEPSYTEEARRRRIRGVAEVQFVVDANGVVRNPRIIKSVAAAYTNPKDQAAALTLDQKAIEAVLQYTFTPGTFHGKPVSVSLNSEISFELL